MRFKGSNIGFKKKVGNVRKGCVNISTPYKNCKNHANHISQCVFYVNKFRFAICATSNFSRHVADRANPVPWSVSGFILLPLSDSTHYQQSRIPTSPLAFPR